MPGAPDHPSTRRDSTRSDRYELRSELGRGGMGVVFRALDRESGAEVAYKVLLDTRQRDSTARFVREASFAHQLDHPGIVSVLDLGVNDGKPYMVMELVEGESLATCLQRERILASEDIAGIVRDIALAVAHAHHAGVIHRDLKPGNVLLDRDGNPRVTDFGLVRSLGSQSLTTTGEILGTPGYMAPEQASGEKDKVGPPADVYSLGAIMYRMLTGVAPYDGRSLMHILLRDPVSPRTLNPAADETLVALALGCMARDPARRPTAQGVADELDRFLRARTAPPPPRRPLFAVFAVTLLVGLAVVGAVFIVVLRRRPAPRPPPPPLPAPSARSRPAAPAAEGPLALEAIWSPDSFGQLTRVDQPPLAGDDRGCALALDAKHHRLFLALANEHRVFVYPLDEQNAPRPGSPVTVIGPKDFETTRPRPLLESADVIRGLAYDEKRDRLYVGDCNRHRVLLYDLAGHTLGAKPVHYLGKIIRGGRPGFPNESGAWFGPNGLHHTAGVAVHDDCIYAVGTDHDRVNIWASEDVDTALALGETAFPRFHLGRFEIGGGREKIELPRDDTNLKTPHGVAAGLGWLFISDRGNDRVLGWRLPIGARRQPASLVLGQADFTSKREPAVASRSSLNGPRDLAVDPQRKKLYVADYENHRVVRYDIAAFDRDVRDADLVLGQKDFDAAEPLATQDGLACPSALAVDPKSGRLFVGDWRTGAVTTFAPARASR